MAGAQKPTMELIYMIAFIAEIKDRLPLSHKGSLNTYGIYVQRRQIPTRQETYYMAGGKWITKLEFSGIPAFLQAPHTAEEAHLKVTKYSAGDWEEKATQTYIKAERINEAIAAGNIARSTGDNEAYMKAQVVFEAAIRDTEPYNIRPTKVFRPTPSTEVQTSCSTQEWGATLTYVLKSWDEAVPSPTAVGEAFIPTIEDFVKDIAACRQAVVLAQELNNKVAARRPQAAELQRPHAELLRFTEQLVKTSQACLSQLELGAKAVDNQRMREYLRAEKETFHASAELSATLQLFGVAMVELVTYHKHIYKELNLPPELSFEPT